MSADTTAMTDIDLLDKTEIWIRGVTLDGANLSSIAKATAQSLAFPEDRVFVTDVREQHIVLDVLIERLSLEQIAGRQAELLAALAAVPGVAVAADASVHSNGVFGVIGASQAQVQTMTEEARRLARSIREYIARRVAVISTGNEVLDGRIRNTNLEYISEAFAAASYTVESGGTVDDDLRSIAGRVAHLAQEGFGLIVTTGGIGAEDKDRTIEALELLDPQLTTAVLASFPPGHGRHKKPSIRIGLARVADAMVVALPGPNHEVRLAVPALLDGLERKLGDAPLLESVAEPLRLNLRHSASH